jgi:Ice-binding-like
MDIRLRHTRAVLATGMALALTFGILAAGQVVFAAAAGPVGLGTAASFAVLAGTPDITNTGPSTIAGNVGISPGAAVSGFPPGTINGKTYKAVAVAVKAKSDLVIAYNDAAGRASTATHATLGGLTLVGGVYNAGGATLDLTGTLTLDAQQNANAVWIFQATSDLVTASSSTVRVINGGQACNVFWQVTSSATLGSGSKFLGTIMALTSITMASGVTVEGRALARNGTVTLINDSVTRSTCAAAPAATRAPTATQPATDAVMGSATRSSDAPAILLLAFFLVAGALVVSRRPSRAARNR